MDEQNLKSERVISSLKTDFNYSPISSSIHTERKTYSNETSAFPTVIERGNTIKKSRFDRKKSLVFSKLVSNELATKIHNSEFEDSSNYLNSDNNFAMLNLKKSGPRFDVKNKLVPYSIVGNIELFDSVYPNINRGLSIKSSKIHNNTLKISDEKKIKNFQSLNNVEFDQIIDTVKLRLKKNNVNEFLSNIPKTLKQSLIAQENVFKFTIKHKNESKIINKLICDKIKKKDCELLTKLEYTNKMKNEIIDILEKKKERTSNFGKNDWYNKVLK